ncbi:MAG: enoyl-CoA hydratase/isomerase family protein [Gammaproteobacteria bacterium]|nr:enoyl-CoA hydratase/isomerase family protein [Gammaproteobacteria bacterium]
MPEVVLKESTGAVMRLVINRPERRNALNEEVCAGIEAGIEAAEADPAIRVIVLTGAGDKAFCAGGDLKPGADGAPFEMNPADPRHYVIRLFRRMERCRLPTIARVNGHALAGGLGLVCACDMAVAADSATLGVPESRIGLFPMMILAYMMRIVPRRKLFEMTITGEPLSSAQALELGILNYVVPAAELDAKMAWLIERIADKSPTAIKLGKQAFRAIEDMPLDKAFEYTQLMLPMMALTEDAREGFAAFNAKRQPAWPGR